VRGKSPKHLLACLPANWQAGSKQAKSHKKRIVIASLVKEKSFFLKKSRYL